MRESVRAREHGSVGAWASVGKTRRHGDGGGQCRSGALESPAGIENAPGREDSR